MAKVSIWICWMLCCVIYGVSGQLLCDSWRSRIDPCYPTYPCNLEQQISNPSECGSYRVCVAPYEYVISREGCGFFKGPFSNVTCSCDLEYKCNEWTCPPPETTSAPMPESEPCFTEEVECGTDYKTIPDRYYCSKYFECDQGKWISKSCNVGEYYNIDLSTDDPPCVNNFAGCQKTPFDECWNLTTIAPTTLADTTIEASTTESYTTDIVTSFTTEVIPGATSNPPQDTTSNGPTQSTGSTQSVSHGTDQTTVPYQTTLHPGSPDACESLGECTNGQKVAHRSDCHVYFECSGGTWEERNCEEINSKKPYYNPQKQKCMKQFMVDCAKRCNTDGIRVDKMTRNILIIVICCILFIVAIILIVALRPDHKSSSKISSPPESIATVDNPLQNPNFIYHVSPPRDYYQDEPDDVELLKIRPMPDVIDNQLIDNEPTATVIPEFENYIHDYSDQRAILYRPVDIDDSLRGHPISGVLMNPVYVDSMADGPRPTNFGFMDL